MLTGEQLQFWKKQESCGEKFVLWLLQPCPYFGQRYYRPLLRVGKQWWYAEDGEVRRAYPCEEVRWAGMLRMRRSKLQSVSSWPSDPGIQDLTHDYQGMTTPSQDASAPRTGQDPMEANDVPPPDDDASQPDVSEDVFEQNQGTSTT